MRTMITMMTKSYSELIQIPTFEERLLYLQTHSTVGYDTFGPYRYLVERFLQSYAWKRFKREIILRDNACDLACDDRPIPRALRKEDGTLASRSNMILIHHINPCRLDDYINQNDEILLNPENVITTTFNTHQQIHYGSKNVVSEIYRERTPGDTCPWR